LYKNSSWNIVDRLGFLAIHREFPLVVVVDTATSRENINNMALFIKLIFIDLGVFGCLTNL